MIEPIESQIGQAFYSVIGAAIAVGMTLGVALVFGLEILAR